MKILNDNSLKELARYLFLSITGYAFVFFFLFFLIDLSGFNKSISFLLVYGCWYLVLYSLQLKFLFNTEHTQKKFIKFCIYLVVFYIIANLLFNFGIYLKINYLLVTLIIIAVLMPLRFITIKYFVYK